MYLIQLEKYLKDIVASTGSLLEFLTRERGALESFLNSCAARNTDLYYGIPVDMPKNMNETIDELVDYQRNMAKTRLEVRDSVNRFELFYQRFTNLESEIFHLDRMSRDLSDRIQEQKGILESKSDIRLSDTTTKSPEDKVSLRIPLILAVLASGSLIGLSVFLNLAPELSTLIVIPTIVVLIRKKYK